MSKSSGRLYRIGVTGTNGKTSITSFIAQIATECGWPAAAVGQRIELPGRTLSRDVVPRGCGGLSIYFQDLIASGIEVVACEAYSAAIARGAHRSIAYDCVVFNNLAEDHYTIHGSREQYWQAKLSFFGSLQPGTPLVVPAGATGEQAILRQALAAGLDIRRPSVRQPQQSLQAGFLAENLSVAIEACLTAGIDPDSVCRAAVKVRLPPGRMVRRRLPNGAQVIVDFAHNAHALRAVLTELSRKTSGDLHLIFGSKGGWGAEKRRRMGDVAAALAASVTVTDDDPRREDPAVIRSQLRGHHSFKVIPDRRLAIRKAIYACKPWDILVIAGRGEDPFYVEAFGRRPFNDLDVVEEIITAL